MKSYVFKALIQEDRTSEGQPAYHASCPALKGCHTWGHTPEEALANIQDAVALYIDDLVAEGEAIPVGPEKGVVEYPSPAVVVNL